MRGCARCAEIEQLLEKTAREHWDMIHRHRGTEDSALEPASVAQTLRASKAALDQAQELYSQHLAAAHPEKSATA
ncbi:MAG TPA: hypothetical protein VLX58_13785 [Bryobacteraceae bacterium]|nr:hypothetical protein [Bryobacteraceae bacterium]